LSERSSFSGPETRTSGVTEGGRDEPRAAAKAGQELVKAARSGDPEALTRLDGREPILARAQLVIAREQGYSSWPALVAAAEANAEEFVLAATESRCGRAEAMLAARPEIERDPWARLVLGRGWDGDPNKPGGPRGWAPLLYVCHSCFGSAALASELLSRGADPNASFVNEYGRMPALYGAAGVVHDPELTRVLLAAGADPNDGESVYHSTEAQSPECLRILLEEGGATVHANDVAHALDEDRLPHVRLLLEHGADPNGAAIMAQAVRRGGGPEFLRLLAEDGADLDRPGGETWRGDVPLRTHPQDRAVAAVARGQRPETPLPDALDPDSQEVLVLAGLRGHAELVLELAGERSSTTRPGSATRSSCDSSSRAAPTHKLGRPMSSTPRSLGRRSRPEITSCRDATSSPWRSSSPTREPWSSRVSWTPPTARSATG
jgi:hypothetical protein